jgi:hypothetical protein
MKDYSIRPSYEWQSLPFMIKSSADIKLVEPSVDQYEEYIKDMKLSIERETDIVKQRKKIIILEEYIVKQHELKNRL